VGGIAALLREFAGCIYRPLGVKLQQADPQSPEHDAERLSDRLRQVEPQPRLPGLVLVVIAGAHVQRQGDLLGLDAQLLAQLLQPAADLVGQAPRSRL
jgi:hypothetical protein